MIISLTAVQFSIRIRRRTKRYKIIFKKLKNGEGLNDEETILLQKLRKQMGTNIIPAHYKSRPSETDIAGGNALTHLKEQEQNHESH